MRLNAIRTSVMLVTILLLPLLVLVAQETSALLVEGQQGQARVIQVQGKNYVEVEGLARITGESLRFAGNQIILTSPSGGNTAPQTEQSAPVPRPAAGLSRPFLSARIETMREILEGHAALKTGIERGYPLSDVWFGNFRRQIQSSLKQAEAAARTDMDQRALPLLTNEFNTMGAYVRGRCRPTRQRLAWHCRRADLPDIASFHSFLCNPRATASFSPLDSYSCA